MAYKYATQNMTSKMAKAVKVSARVSTKQAIEIAKFIKGRKVKDAIRLLGDVTAKKFAIPYTRFNADVGHKPGIAAGRYPQNASNVFIEILKVCVANAIDKSLDEDSLVIFNVVAQRGAKSFRYGRIQGRKVKNTHIEMVIVEAEAKKVAPKKAPAKVVKEQPKKTEKPVENKPVESEPVAKEETKTEPVKKTEEAVNN
ncbi:MAG: large subunit ribosomal protein L22 [Candidatus Woesearchaeota archaeon]|jgi:large subunit ribosomal protein L22